VAQKTQEAFRMKEHTLAEMLCSGKNIILDAGAGSGKTTTLINAVTALFLTDTAVTPEEVLLLTFTEKAAAEMRERLLYLWQSLLAKVRSSTGSGIAHILADYPGDLSLSAELAASSELLLKRLTGMNEHFGRLNASTLHSFCLTLLREHTVEAGCDPDFEVIDSFERDRAFEDAFREFLGEEFEKGPFDGRWRPFFSLFPDLEGGKEFLRSFFREMCLNTRDLLFLFRDQTAMMKGTDLQPYFTAFQIPYFRKIQEYLSAASPVEEEVSSLLGRLAVVNGEILTCLSAGTLPASETLDSFMRIISSIDGNRLKSREHFPLNSEQFTTSAFDGGDLVTDTFRCTLPKLRNRATRSARILRRILSGVLTGDLLAEKTGRMLALFDHHKRGNLDFMDLLLNAVSLVTESKTVRETLKKRYRYLFIDEFQDTDPVQAYLCSFICEKQGASTASLKDVELEPGKLFIVGDPRQSIYRFRRADPQMHFSMITLVARSGGERMSLPANYRSRPALVSFFNAFFRATFDRDSDYSFPYGPDLQPGRAAFSDAPPVRYYSLDGEVEREAFTASLIRGLISSGLTIVDGKTERPVSWRDVAVLYAGDYGKKVLSPLREKLNEAEIPSLTPSLRGFFDRQEVKDLLFLIETLCDPANRTALYGTLKSTIFGFTDTQLSGYFTNAASPSPELAEALAMIHRWRSLRDTVGVHELISTALEECGYVYTTLLFPDGERVFFNVEKLLLVAREFDQKHSSSLRDFAVFLRQQTQVGSEEGEFPYFEEGEDAVRIMSIHSSKGLEFPVVIYYLTGEPAREDPGPILYDRIGGNFGFTERNFSTPSCYQMVEDTIWESGSPRTEVVPFVVLEKRKEDAEALRLSYVAMTRARDLLILVSQPPKAGRMRKNTIATKLEAFLEPFRSEESACPITKAPGITHQVEENLRVFTSRVSRPVVAGAARKKRWRPDIPPIRLEEVKSALSPVLPERGGKVVAEEEGYGFGSTVHRILEFMPPFDGSLFRNDGRLSRSFFDGKEERGRFLHMVEKMQKSNLLKKYGNWQILGTELPVTSEREGAVWREAADVVLRDGPRLLVLDYKTGDREKERDAESSEQVSGYARSIGAATGLNVSAVVWYVEQDEWIEIAASSGGGE
jgi:ATP-dependent helicase/nuclease subunit A